VSNQLRAVIERIAEARRAEIGRSNTVGRSSQELPAVIDRIRRAYHDDWEQQSLPFAQALLRCVSGGIPVPTLSVCGHGTAETRYTQYLAHFLDPSRLHGLGSGYLDSVISLLRRNDPSILADIDTALAQTTAECDIGRIPGDDGEPVGCAVDVVVECPGHIIFIENKIKSGESPHRNSRDRQLTRYDRAIDGNPTYENLTKTRVYLTQDGKDGLGLHEWTGLSHSDLAEAGLDLLRSGTLAHIARENLTRFVIDVLLGPYEKAEDEVRSLEQLANAAIRTDFSARVRFDRAVSRNQMLVDLLMEGSQ